MKFATVVAVAGAVAGGADAARVRVCTGTNLSGECTTYVNR